LPDAVGRPSLGSALLDDPGAKFSAENEQQVQKEKKRAKKCDFSGSIDRL